MGDALAAAGKREAAQVAAAAVAVKAETMLQRIRGLTDVDVLPIGLLRHDIVALWADDAEGNLGAVLTGRQRGPYLFRHPEMESLETVIVDAVLNPDEVHRNKRDPMMAMFYQRFDETHYVRVAVLMQARPNERKHSILSYRLAGEEEVQNNQHRRAWKREG